MRKLYLVIISVLFTFLLACNNSSTIPDIIEEQEVQIVAEETKEDLIQEVPIEEAKELALEDDDIEDPETITINITDDNIDEYFDLTVCEKTNSEGITLYYVQTHCLLLDQGFTCVDYENALFNCGYAAYNDTQTGNLLEMDGTFLTDSPFEHNVGWFLSKEDAEKYAELGIKHFKPHFRSENATLYFEKMPGN